ncbi:MAG TPA: circularly permuted type 2 ATP-grasp protein [Roseiarcus sp.]|nr:circularly permuted type 2 ATP-grasp protein [Roseiarcus sp.]
MLSALADCGPSELQQRFAAADRRIRNRGLSYRVAGEKDERVWPISRMPLLIPESEWRRIAKGVVQRAELLERLLVDVYGEGRLIAEGALPAAAVTGTADYVPAMRGVKPPGGQWLRLYAVDIGRGPDGSWWVISDRAQAPSGCGYALENRLVVSQALPDLYSQLNVERLAPFFRELGAGLKSAGHRAEPRIAILTPGPMSQTYYEQAYLARYLGFLLVEGDDLVMREGRIFVRTIAGLKRCDVIWRHIDADWCDPLELNSSSRIGVPGLIEAVRRNGVALENMPGAGMVESRAMLAFLPALAPRLLGQDLLMPNIATWWCGQPGERDRVLEEIEKISIAPAFGNELPGEPGRSSVVWEELANTERLRLRDAIAKRGLDYVGQEIVRLSTTPRWIEDRIEPRPFVLRVYCAATPGGWRVMPGGFCRISDRPDARAVSMGDGVESADVWVLAENPVEVTSLLPSPQTVRIIRLLGNLPSRAADNLFWFGRYLERAEATLRVVRCLSARSVDPDTPRVGRRPLEQLISVLVDWNAVGATTLTYGAAAAANQGLLDPTRIGSALSATRLAQSAASVIRERLTLQTWELVGRLESALDLGSNVLLSAGAIVDLADEALLTIAALSGLFDENFNRGAGWVFYVIGRCLERGANTCSLLRQFAGDDATEQSLGVMLDLIDSRITYSSRYLIGVALAPVRDMALLDPFNPRSVAFQVNRIDEGINTLPVLTRDGILEEPRRLVTLLKAELTTEKAETLDEERIFAFEQSLLFLADSVAARYFLQGADHGRAEKVIGLA